MKELICIVCPKGCHLRVDEANDYAVTGNACPRGAEYGRNELTNPTRVLTSVVRIDGAEYPCCPVRTNGPVPKKEIFAVMQTLRNVRLQSPVEIGQVVIENVCGTGADWIVTRDL